MPPSRIESVPSDVFHHIVVLCCASSILKPPHVLLQLLLTCRGLYNALCMQARPELYADLFMTRFDIATPRRRLPALKTSCFAGELTRRYHVLRRVGLGVISDEHVLADLWTLYLMVLEGDHLNEKQLRAFNVTQFVATCLHKYFPQGAEQFLEGPQLYQLRSLSLWLFWHLVSYDEIRSEVFGSRNELLGLIRRFSSCEYAPAPTSPLPNSVGPRSQSADRRCTIRHFSHEICVTCPDLSAAAVLLTLVLKDSVIRPPLPHAQPREAMAKAEHRTGPSIEDYAAMLQFTTPLWANTTPHKGTSRSMMQDDDFYRMTPAHDLPAPISSYTYLPGTLSGLWEGILMISPLLSQDTDDFVCRVPLQCDITEYACFSPDVPIPTLFGSGQDSVSHGTWNVEPRYMMRCDDGFEIEQSKVLHKYLYEPYSSAIVSTPAAEDDSRRNSREVLDVVLYGQTQWEHDRAWGGYKFSGRVRVTDGFVVLIREPKNERDYFGTWIFEGYIYSGIAFVGRWRSFKASEQRCEGIFSLSKKPSSDFDLSLQ